MRKKRLQEHSIFELLSDISLSTLGLFLVFFVVYSLIFNSANIAPIDRINNLNNKIFQLETDLKNANIRADSAENEKRSALGNISNLNNNINELNNKIYQLETNLKNANTRADSAENEKRLALEKNKYTGYYKGTSEMKFYYVSCYSDSYDIIPEEIALIYLQTSNTIIYSTKSEKGTISYKIEGSLEGNTFRGRFSNYARSQNYEACNSSPDEKTINFFEDSLEMYNSSDSSGKVILRKEG